MLDASSPTGIWVRSAVEVGYVATIAILAIIATSDPNNLRPSAFIAALVLCLPSMVLVLPVFYVAVGTAFNVTGADNGGTTWPVTVTYVAVFTFAAVVNVWLASVAIRAHRRRRNAQSPTP